MGQRYSKRVRKMLHKYAAKAYEIELRQELTQLAQSFEEWKQGTISSEELNCRIHQYDRGPSRELYRCYDLGNEALNVAYALVTGMIARDHVPPELLKALQGSMSFFQDLQERGELKHSGEE